MNDVAPVPAPSGGIFSRLWVRLLLAFAGVVLFAVVMPSLYVRRQSQAEFQNYSTSTQTQVRETVAGQLAADYVASGGNWRSIQQETVGFAEIISQRIIVTDQNGIGGCRLRQRAHGAALHRRARAGIRARSMSGLAARGPDLPTRPDPVRPRHHLRHALRPEPERGGGGARPEFPGPAAPGHLPQHRDQPRRGAGDQPAARPPDRATAGGADARGAAGWARATSPSACRRKGARRWSELARSFQRDGDQPGHGAAAPAATGRRCRPRTANAARQHPGLPGGHRGRRSRGRRGDDADAARRGRATQRPDRRPAGTGPGRGRCLCASIAARSTRPNWSSARPTRRAPARWRRASS